MCAVNKKKPLRMKNRTKYFCPDSDRSHVCFSSPYSYQFRTIKQESYETRLYWQFRHCCDCGGKTFFFTLTYRDGAIPNHYGTNCFDYEDLRYLFVGGFRKMLYRKFGATFKYFVGAELGDGKGVRGMHNNPHYHVLFFVEPAEKPYSHSVVKDVPDGFYLRNGKYHKKGDVRFKKVHETVSVPYCCPSADEFTHLLKMYWQGFDEKDGFRDYNTSLFGIVKEGQFGAEVLDFRALSYCSKYVCKDAGLVQHEEKVARQVRFKLRRETLKDDVFYHRFFMDVINPLYNTPLNSKKTEWLYSPAELYEHLVEGYRCSVMKGFEEYVRIINSRYHLWDKFYDYLNSYILDQVNLAINEWRNRFSNKCRISQGVGDYALQFVGDKMNPTFKVPDKKKGFKNRPMSMYYYRKLFTEVVKPTEETALGKVREYPAIRVLNEDGIKYKVAHLKERVNKKAEQARNNISLLLDNPALFEKMKQSDINTEVFCSHEDFVKQVEKLKLNGERWRNLFTAYAEYKLVYEDRYFKVPSLGSDDVFDFPVIDPCGDYARFLVPSVYSVSRSDLRLDLFLEGDSEDYLPYSQHPAFLCYLGLFHILDMCADYWFIQNDDKAQREAEEIAATRRFHSERKLKEFYSQFK